MTTTPQEPLEEPEVVPSGDPGPIATPDPEKPNEEATEPENLHGLAGPREFPGAS
jgi:hypothetical protein